MEQAWVRPRLKGYIVFQHETGLVVERLTRGEMDVRAAMAAIITLAYAVG